MKRLLISGLILLLLLSGCNKENELNEIELTFGGTPEANFGSNTLIKANDNNIVVTYYSQNVDTPKSEIHLKKIDKDLKEIWDKTYSDENGYYAYSLVQANDNGYVIAGAKRYGDVNQTYIYLLKTDSNGEKIWEKTYGIGSYGWGRVVRQQANGNLVILSFNGLNPYLIKTNANGDTIWTNELNKSIPYTSFNDVIITNDENILLVGEKIVKMNNDGKVIWNINLNGLIDNTSTSFNGFTINSVVQSNDNSYILYGSVGNGDTTDYQLVKLSENGEIIWQKAYDYGVRRQFGRFVKILPDEDIIMIGTSTDNDERSLISVKKTNSLGVPIWDYNRNFSIDYVNQGLSILNLENNEYIILGVKGENKSKKMILNKFIK